MVMATRSGFAGEVSLGGAAPVATGEGEGNALTWPVRASFAPGADAGGSVAGGAGGSSAGATAVAKPADEAVPPSSRFQSDGGGVTFQIFAGDSSSTPT